MISTIRRRLTGESGQALVEFALVLPILLLLIVGILDLARAYHRWNEQTNLAEQGARYAAVGSWPGSTAATPVSLTKYLCDSLAGTDSGLANQHPTITIGPPPNVTTSAAGDPVQVEVTSTYKLLPFLSKSISVSVPLLDGKATMRLETAAPSGMYATKQC